MGQECSDTLDHTGILHLAFPYYQHRVADRLELHDRLTVPLDIATKLGLPVLGTGPGRPPRQSASMLVPETTMHENRLSAPDESEIRRARQVAPI